MDMNSRSDDGMVIGVVLENAIGAPPTGAPRRNVRITGV